MGKKKKSKGKGKNKGKGSNKTDKPVKVKERNKNKSNGSKANKGKKRWVGKFAEQLASLGLRFRNIEPDGNCLFRSLADQMTGMQSDHRRFREEVVDYMREEPDDFAPFVFDQDWDEYLDEMYKDGEWGGDLEIVAASRLYERHIIVHQLEAARLEFHCPFKPDAPELHLAYEDGQHYNSVRRVKDSSYKPADVKLKLASGAASEDSWLSGASKDEKIIVESTGCGNMFLVREALADNGGDVDATIEYLIALREAGVDNFEAPSEEQQQANDAASAAAAEPAPAASSSGRPPKRDGPPRKGDPCPCGSGQKYKKCCSKRKRSSSRKAKRIQKLSNKERKQLRMKQKREEKKGKGGKERSGSTNSESGADAAGDEDVPVQDFGALVI